MPTLQQAFLAEGTVLNSPLEWLNIKFKYPDAVFSVKEDSNGVIVRTVNGEGETDTSQAVTSTKYSAELPVNCITGDPDKYATLAYCYINKVLQNAEDCLIDDLTIDVTPVFFSDEEAVLGTAEILSAVYFLKNQMKAGHFVYESESGGVNIGNGNLDTTFPIAEAKNRFEQNAFLVNRTAYDALLTELGIGKNPGVFALYPLMILSWFVDISKGEPTLIDTLSTEDNAQMQRLFSYYIDNGQLKIDVIKSYFDRLFDFPISTKSIQLQKAGGTFTVKTAGDTAITMDNLALYNVSLEFETLDEDGNAVGQDIYLDWSANKNKIVDNSIPFSFSEAQIVVPASAHETMTVYVRSADSIILWSKDYKAGSTALENIKIEVPMLGTGSISPLEQTKSNTKRLRGQLIDMTKLVELKDAVVLVQAKEAGDTAWRNVASATTDASGNFSMPFPYGVYVAAQALVSLMPDSPAPIPVNPDNGKNCTISEDFLYLLLKDVKPVVKSRDEKDDDCDCHSNNVKASRLPDHTDLINSDEYTQDLGAGCIKLSTPNRTLNEYSYQAVVRTSDPDVANYTLTKEVTTATVMEGATATEAGVSTIVTTEKYTLTSANKKIKRRSVDLSNPVRWQDAPDQHENLNFYQAVTVSTGHILHYKSEFKADGYSLGELLYSLPLAPGQKKQIVMFDSQHSLQGSESQQLSLTENLASNLVNDRNISDQLGGTISEGLRGSSSATTAGISAAAGAAGSMGSVGGALGVAGGWSNANSDASQDSSRNISQFFNEKLRNSILQNADSYRQQNATVVSTVNEGQKYGATTEVVANHNHCHSLTMMYFEVLKHYAIFQELTNVEECVFVPLIMTNFTSDNIYKWRDVLAPNLLPLPSNTYLPAVDGMHPLAKSFDATERVKADWKNVDFPLKSFGEDPVRYIKGSLSMTVNLQRPKTRYDRIISFPLVEHKEGGPSYWDVLKNAVLAPFTAGFPVFGTEERTVQARSKIFDSFMTLDANYQTVSPAECIRVTNFQRVAIDPAILAAFGLNTTSASGVSGDDFFDGEDADNQTWMAIYAIMNDGFKDVYAFLSHYFKDKLISEWDQIYYNDIAPELFNKIAKSLALQQTTDSGATIDGSISGFNASFTPLSRYRGGEVTMYLNAYATTTTQRHNLGEKLRLISIHAGVGLLKNFVTLRLEALNLTYSTAHFNGPLFSGYIGQDIFNGAYIDIPETDADKRNPRTEDRYLVTRLIQHLNSNLEYYNKVLWYNLDTDRRYMLLDGFNIQVFNDYGVPIGLKSLASVIKNELVTVAGNALVFPVSSGFKVNKSYIVEKSATGSTETVSLLSHYKPLTPIPPYRVSVPSRGVFAEAVNGSCNSCEKVEANTSQDWNVFKPDEPTTINSLTAPTAAITDWKATFKDLASSTLKIQDAPTTPTPGAGLEKLSEALTKADTFKDITGLSENQKNAVDVYKTNTAAVVKMAEMAKGMAMQEHNTDKSDQIMEKLKSARNSGALSEEDYNNLVKKHLEKQIDGSKDSDQDETDKQEAATKKEEAAKVTASTTNAIDKGQGVQVDQTDSKGNSKSVKIEAKDTTADSAGSDKMTGLSKLADHVVAVKPDSKKNNTEWAGVVTMMLNWKNKTTLSNEEAVKKLGDTFVKLYADDKNIPLANVADLLKGAGLKAEDNKAYTTDEITKLMDGYGPLWITVGQPGTEGTFLTSNSKLIVEIIGKPKGNLSEAVFKVISPDTGTEEVMTYADWQFGVRSLIAKNTGGKGYTEFIHFADKIPPSAAESES